MNVITAAATQDTRVDLMQVILQSVGIRRHIEVFLWMNGELQRFLPHDIMIVAWGDFDKGTLLFDLISPLPEVRTQRLASPQIIPFVVRLFTGWVERGGTPYVVENENGFSLGQEILDCLPVGSMRKMRFAVVHGVRDVRGGNDCVYISLSASRDHDRDLARRSMAVLLPHIDLALRRLAHMESELSRDGRQHSTPVNADQASQVDISLEELGLSRRQLEIMDWVCLGKTNLEIGQILDISMFTVKNHLQRVLKKLDVLNRAQAVAKLSPKRRVGSPSAHV